MLTAAISITAIIAAAAAIYFIPSKYVITTENHTANIIFPARYQIKQYENGVISVSTKIEGLFFHTVFSQTDKVLTMQSVKENFISNMQAKKIQYIILSENDTELYIGFLSEKIKLYRKILLLDNTLIEINQQSAHFILPEEYERSKYLNPAITDRQMNNRTERIIYSKSSDNP